MTKVLVSSATIVLALGALSFTACSKDEAGSKGASKGVALTSPDLCEHVMSLDKELDESRCIMRLDGLQLQLGEDDWKAHGSCIAKVTSKAEYDSCLAAADAFSMKKASGD